MIVAKEGFLEKLLEHEQSFGVTQRLLIKKKNNYHQPNGMQF